MFSEKKMKYSVTSDLSNRLKKALFTDLEIFNCSLNTRKEHQKK